MNMNLILIHNCDEITRNNHNNHLFELRLTN